MTIHNNVKKIRGSATIEELWRGLFIFSLYVDLLDSFPREVRSVLFFFRGFDKVKAYLEYPKTESCTTWRHRLQGDVKKMNSEGA